MSTEASLFYKEIAHLLVLRLVTKGYFDDKSQNLPSSIESRGSDVCRYNKTNMGIPSSHIGFLVASICIWLYLISFDFNVIVLDVV